MRKLRIGVAGMGFGGAVHVPGLQSLPDVSVTAIAGKRAVAGPLADRFGIPHVADSWEGLLDHDLDAVTFALPPLENERACRAALARRIPVLSEKPLAASATAAADIAELAKGTTTAVDFQFAELEAFQRLKALLAAKPLGAVRHIQVTWMVESYSQKQGIWSWKTDAARAGGVTTLLGSHLFYLLEWIFGEISTIESRSSSDVTAIFAPAGAVSADDRVDIWAEFASGIELSATYGNAFPAGPGHRWEIFCERGTMTLVNPTQDYMAGFSLSVSSNSGTHLEFRDSPESGVDGRLAAFSSLAGRFVRAITTGGDMEPDFTAGARVQQLMEFVQTKSKGRKVVPRHTNNK